jgi:anti-anti-sigma factor
VTLEIERLEPGNGFRIAGEVDAATAGRLEEALAPALDGTGDVTLDLAGLEFVDSTGLRVLLAAVRVLRDHDRRLVFLSPQPAVREVLDLVGLAAYGGEVHEEPVRTLVRRPTPRPDPDAVERTFAGHPGQLAQLRALIRDLAERDALSEAETNRLLLAVNEAATNAIVHARSREVRFRWRSTVEAVTIEVTDSGIFAPNIPPPELDGEGRRGIPVMMAVMDEVELDEGTADRPGTTVRLVLRRPTGSNRHTA